MKKRHSAGWYAGATAFWLLTAWLITVGLSSIIPQIFWPTASSTKRGESCAPELQGLRNELLSRTSESIAAAPLPGDRDALRTWLAAWDARLGTARAGCTDKERTAWDELARLRHGLSALVERFDREQAPHIEKLDALLGPSADTRAPQP